MAGSLVDPLHMYYRGENDKTCILLRLLGFEGQVKNGGQMLQIGEEG
jgi:hypothetical protein